MMNCRTVRFSVVAAALIGFAAAQSSKPASSSPKPSPDPLKTSMKPLTPKSAMPSRRKAAVVAPNRATRRSNPNAELTRLERQNSISGAAKSGGTAPAKGTAANPVGTSARSGSGIDFKYQKPVGQKAATHGAGRGPTTPDASKEN